MLPSAIVNLLLLLMQEEMMVSLLHRSSSSSSSSVLAVVRDDDLVVDLMSPGRQLLRGGRPVRQLDGGGRGRHLLQLQFVDDGGGMFLFPNDDVVALLMPRTNYLSLSKLTPSSSKEQHQQFTTTATITTMFVTTFTTSRRRLFFGDFNDSRRGEAAGRK